MNWESLSYASAAYTVKIFSCKIFSFPLSVWNFLTVASRDCVLQYHAHVTFIRQIWIHFNLVSVSDAAFNLRFLRWWKCISFKWLVELKKKKNWVGGSDKHPDQPASPDSIQDLTSCYTEKQSFGGETACQRARQLRERATHQLPDHSGCISKSKKDSSVSAQWTFPQLIKMPLAWPIEIPSNLVRLHHFSPLTSAQGEVRKETECK